MSVIEEALREAGLDGIHAKVCNRWCREWMDVRTSDL